MIDVIVSRTSVLLFFFFFFVSRMKAEIQLRGGKLKFAKVSLKEVISIIEEMRINIKRRRCNHYFMYK